MESELKWFLVDNFETFLKNPNKEKWENVNITYEFEVYKYGNNFLNFRKHKDFGKGKEIACFGCSNTFGLGLPEEWTWPYELAKLFDLNKFSFKNYGLNGASIETISLLIYEFIINQNKNMEAVFVLFPDTFRYLYGIINDNQMQTIDFLIQSGDNEKRQIDLYEERTNISYLSLMTNQYFSFYRFIKSYKFIEDICKIKNIPLYWHSWSENITELDDNILNKDNSLNGEQRNKMTSLHRNEKARDNAHVGHEYNKELAKYFHEKYIEENN